MLGSSCYSWLMSYLKKDLKELRKRDKMPFSSSPPITLIEQTGK